MNHERMESFRRRLLGLRIALLRRRAQALADEQGLLTDHELDWTDAATNETAANVLESLSETERKALDRINASLDRMERGSYGDCAVCAEPIDERRLQALPDTDRCVRCATAPVAEARVLRSRSA